MANQRHDKTQETFDPFLCFTVYSTGLAFNRVYKPLLNKLGLTYPQYLAMISLWQNDGQKVSELGEQLYLESNTLTPLLKRLEAAGLIARRRDANDERVVRVSLTSKGRELAEDAAGVPGCILEASGMTGGDLERLNVQLQALRRNLVSNSG